MPGADTLTDTPGTFASRITFWIAASRRAVTAGVSWVKPEPLDAEAEAEGDGTGGAVAAYALPTAAGTVSSAAAATPAHALRHWWCEYLTGRPPAGRGASGRRRPGGNILAGHPDRDVIRYHARPAPSAPHGGARFAERPAPCWAAPAVAATGPPTRAPSRRQCPYRTGPLTPASADRA
ncbi:hypothetical protein GCM10022284_69120 [Streptomyces hundungensis]